MGQAFYDSDFDVKQAIAQTVAAVGLRKSGRGSFDLGLYDQKTGKRVGFFSTSGGGLSME